jgi:hypothetical protein
MLPVIIETIWGGEWTYYHYLMAFQQDNLL